MTPDSDSEDRRSKTPSIARGEPRGYHGRGGFRGRGRGGCRGGSNMNQRTNMAKPGSPMSPDRPRTPERPRRAVSSENRSPRRRSHSSSWRSQSSGSSRRSSRDRDAIRRQASDRRKYVSSRSSPPRRSSPRRYSPRRSSPRRSPPRRSSPRRSPPRRSSPRRSPPRRSSPRRYSPRRSSPKRYSPRRSSPKRSSPRRNSPRRRSSDDRSISPDNRRDRRRSTDRCSPDRRGNHGRSHYEDRYSDRRRRDDSSDVESSSKNWKRDGGKRHQSSRDDDKRRSGRYDDKKHHASARDDDYGRRSHRDDQRDYRSYYDHRDKRHRDKSLKRREDRDDRNYQSRKEKEDRYERNSKRVEEYSGGRRDKHKDQYPARDRDQRGDKSKHGGGVDNRYSGNKKTYDQRDHKRNQDSGAKNRYSGRTSRNDNHHPDSVKETHQKDDNSTQNAESPLLENKKSSSGGTSGHPVNEGQSPCSPISDGNQSIQPECSSPLERDTKQPENHHELENKQNEQNEYRKELERRWRNWQKDEKKLARKQKKLARKQKKNDCGSDSPSSSDTESEGSDGKESVLKNGTKTESPSTLTSNIFEIFLQGFEIRQYKVNVALVESINNKAHILTSASPKLRGNRAEKINDCYKLLKHAVLSENVGYIYDGINTLFTWGKRKLQSKEHLIKDNDFAKLSLSSGLMESQKYLNGHFSVIITQIDAECYDPRNPDNWSKPNFLNFVNVLTCANVRKDQSYTPLSKGLLVRNDSARIRSCGWVETMDGVHKSCRIIKDGEDQKLVVQLDPHQTQFYAEIPLNVIFKKAFPQLNLSEITCRPDKETIQSIQGLFKGRRVVEGDHEKGTWRSMTHIISNVVLEPIEENSEGTSKEDRKEKAAKFQLRAVVGWGDKTRKMKFEDLRPLRYQRIDADTLAQFHLVPKPPTPDERWKLVKKHHSCLFPPSGCVTDPAVFSDPLEALTCDVKASEGKRGVPFARPATIDCLYILTVVSEIDKDEAAKIDQIMETFVEKCKEKDMKIKKVEKQMFMNAQYADVAILEWFRKVDRAPKTEMPLIVMISHGIENAHNLLKYYEKQFDIPTQHIQKSTLLRIHANLEKKRKDGKKLFDMALSNICSKTNIKCGGINYMPDSKSGLYVYSDLWAEKAIVIGIDVAHPKESDPHGHSIVGICSNSLEKPYEFTGDFYVTNRNEESVDVNILNKFMTDRLAKVVGTSIPKRIIFFRDGVSETEEKSVLDGVHAIMPRIMELIHPTSYDYEEDDQDEPEVQVIVVRKRHHTRFFAEGDDSKKTNPEPSSSVVGVSDSGKRQIYIQAHRAVQGTAKFPCFVVLKDTVKSSDSELASMIEGSCNLHQISDGATSIPTAVFVAHELAKRGMTIYNAHVNKTKQQFSGTNDSITNQLSYAKCKRLLNNRLV